MVVVIAGAEDRVGVHLTRVGRRRIKAQNLEGPLLLQVLLQVVLLLVEAALVAGVHCLHKEANGLGDGEVVSQLSGTQRIVRIPVDDMAANIGCGARSPPSLCV
ncbi:hypothetical protein TYRP_000614 [Tyrophagus putrescentiae]|nr:hypothetical protein TYRP_000614 [Tyrophagus putrescentiae]